MMARNWQIVNWIRDSEIDPTVYYSAHPYKSLRDNRFTLSLLVNRNRIGFAIRRSILPCANSCIRSSQDGEATLKDRWAMPTLQRHATIYENSVASIRSLDPPGFIRLIGPMVDREKH